MPDQAQCGFIIRNFAVLNYANGQTLWHYKAGIDLICQTMADGYFHNAADMIADGDVLIIKGHDGTAMRVASKPDNDTVVLSVLV